MRASRSSWAHMWVLSASSNEYSSFDEAMGLWQRRHIESLVPSKLLTCWKANLVVYRNEGKDWVATMWPRFMRRDDLGRYFESTRYTRPQSGSIAVRRYKSLRVDGPPTGFLNKKVRHLFSRAAKSLPQQPSQFLHCRPRNLLLLKGIRWAGYLLLERRTTIATCCADD
jgi:hypothetical protein